MPEMITKLNSDQKALMPKVRDHWLKVGLATAKQIKRDAAQEAITQSYTCADLRPPEQEFIHFARSPMEGAITVAVCRELWENQNQTKPTWARVQPLVDRYMEMRLADQSLPENIKKGAQDAFQWACYGQHDAGWLAFYDYFQQIGVEGLEQLDGLKKAAKFCGWWWPMSHIAVVTEQPINLGLDDQGRLHHGNARAIEYNDDWGLWVWNGTNVPKRYITDPDSITAQEVIEQENAEMRRIMVERMTPERFAEESNAKTLDEDTDKLGLPRKLIQVEMPTGEPWTAVQVMNSSEEPDGSRRSYSLRVPPTTTSCAEGIAWTVEKEAGEYNPDVEA